MVLITRTMEAGGGRGRHESDVNHSDQGDGRCSPDAGEETSVTGIVLGGRQQGEGHGSGVSISARRSGR